MGVLHYVSHSFLISQVLFTAASSEGDPVNIQGNMVYDKLKKNIYMTFHGPNLANAIRTLIDQTDGYTPENLSAGSSNRYINTQRVLGTIISQNHAPNTQQASKVTQHQGNINGLFNKRPVQDGNSNAGGHQSKWHHTSDGITPGISVEKYFLTTNNYALNRLYQNDPAIDKKSSLKALHGILTDDFGETLFGTESEKHFEMAALRAHNRYRKIHTSPPLRLNQELSREAEARAKVLAGLGQVEHDNQNALWNSSKGENVARFCGDVGLTASGAVKRWYDEVCYYNWNSTDVLPNTRRFRQLIRKESNELGIGRSKGSINGQTCTYIVAYYRPVLMPRELTHMYDGKIAKGLFKQTYCQEKKIYTGRKMEQSQTKPKTYNNTNVHTNNLQNLQLIKNKPNLHAGNGNSLQRLMSMNNGGGNETIKPFVKLRNATNETLTKGLRSGSDAKVKALANKTRTSIDATQKQSGFHTKSREHGRVTDQVMQRHAFRKVKNPGEQLHEEGVGLNIGAGSPSELLDEEPTESWRDSEASPITLEGDHRDTALQRARFAMPSEEVSQYGNPIPQIQPGVPEETLDDLRYTTRQLEEYHQANGPTEGNDRPLLDMDATEDVKDLALPDSFIHKYPSPTHYRGDDLPPKLYQQMQDSLGGIDDGGIDEYQPQDDFTVTMEPDHDRDFSDDSDDEGMNEDSLFNSYNGMKHRNGQINEGMS